MIVIFVLSKIPTLNNESILVTAETSESCQLSSPLFNIIQEVIVNAVWFGTKTRSRANGG